MPQDISIPTKKPRRVQRSHPKFFNPHAHHGRHGHGRTPVFANEFLREPSKENQIFIDLKIILVIMQVAGLLPIFHQIKPFEIAIGTPASSSRSRSRSSSICYAFIMRWAMQAFIVLYMYASATTDSNVWSYSNSGTDIGNKWIELSLGAIAASATILLCGFQRRKFVKILNDILQTDKELFEQFRRYPRNNCSFIRKYLIGIGAWQTYVVGTKLLYQSFDRRPVSFFILAVYLIKNALVTGFIVFLAALLRIVEMRFAYLNFILARYEYTYRRLYDDHSHTDRWITMDTFPENSVFIIRAHNGLLGIYKSINECCHLIILSFMGYTFYTITENTYYVFLEITYQYTDVCAEILLWGLSWLALHIALIRLFCQSCDRATREANAITLHFTRIYEKKKDHQNIIDKYLIKTIKQKIEFTAYGFFTIDISTLFKIFSAVTTYLVILIQFKQLEDAKTTTAGAEGSMISNHNSC